MGEGGAAQRWVGQYIQHNRTCSRSLMKSVNQFVVGSSGAVFVVKEHSHLK